MNLNEVWESKRCHNLNKDVFNLWKKVHEDVKAEINELARATVKRLESGDFSASESTTFGKTYREITIHYDRPFKYLCGHHAPKIYKKLEEFGICPNLIEYKRVSNDYSYLNLYIAPEEETLRDSNINDEELLRKANKKSLSYDKKYSEDGTLRDMLSRPQSFVEGAIEGIVNLLRQKAYRDGYINGAEEFLREVSK